MYAVVLHPIYYCLYHVAEGEDITMYTLLKTTDQAVLAQRITGAEANIRIDVGGIVTSLDQVS